ncbi:MAG: ABC transporter substrate-binding protein, partial [Acidobacteria bacterium]|nr:ABC transporter substrate-binding protein [Acidobacteriota bacterium]
MACGSAPVGDFVDQTGRRMTATVPTRIVALAPDVAELAFAAGLADRVVAVATAVDYPEAARGLRRVALTDVEAIVAVAPDLVLATTAGNDPRTIDRLAAAGIAVCTFDVTSFDRLVEACRLLARLNGQDPGTDALAARLHDRAETATRRGAILPRRGALYVVWWDPLIVAAPGTFHDDLLRRAGLTNLAPTGAGRYPRLDPELLGEPRLERLVAPDEGELRSGLAAIATTPVGRLIATRGILIY